MIRFALLIVGVVVAARHTGVGQHLISDAGGGDETVVAVVSGGGGGDAKSVLASLEVTAEHRGGYDRELFAHWSDLDANGCDTRRDVLASETLQGAVSGCAVTGGMWLSMYDNVMVADAGAIEIDHVVALAEAWDSGAWRWDARTRELYANDVGDGRTLAAVTSVSNQDKSAYDLAEWQPTHNVCAYTEANLAVKARWQLSVDEAEHQAVAALLDGECSGLIVASWPPVAGASSTGGQASGASFSMDGRYGSCAEVRARGLGPYVQGTDLEYEWYSDDTSSGVVCN